MEKQKKSGAGGPATSGEMVESGSRTQAITFPLVEEVTADSRWKTACYRGLPYDPAEHATDESLREARILAGLLVSAGFEINCFIRRHQWPFEAKFELSASYTAHIQVPVKDHAAARSFLRGAEAVLKSGGIDDHYQQGFVAAVQMLLGMATQKKLPAHRRSKVHPYDLTTHKGLRG